MKRLTIMIIITAKYEAPGNVWAVLVYSDTMRLLPTAAAMLFKKDVKPFKAPENKYNTI